MSRALSLAETLAKEGNLPDQNLLELIRDRDPETACYLKEQADPRGGELYWRHCFIRDLIGFIN